VSAAWLGWALAMGCASPGFHEGRTSLARDEQACLMGGGSGQGGFARFWRSPKLVHWGFLKWQEDASWAAPAAPVRLLQAIRDELGRVNAQAGHGADLALAVTVYRFERAGFWSKAAASYELVARDQAGRVVWAADDKVEVRKELARTLADSASTIIAREILRKVLLELGSSGASNR